VAPWRHRELQPWGSMCSQLWAPDCNACHHP
jgi:hypothetical protein